MKNLKVDVSDSTISMDKITPAVAKKLAELGATVTEITEGSKKGKAKIDFGAVDLGTVPENKGEISDYKAVLANNEQAERVIRRAAFVSEKLSSVGLASSAAAEKRVKTADALVAKGKFASREEALAFLTENGL